MAGNPNLTFARLLDWLEGRLPATEAQIVTQQVAVADEAVQVQVKWLTAFCKLSNHIVLAPLPFAVRTTLRQRFAAFAQTRQPPPFLQRLVAVLTFDSRHQSALAGLRATASEPVRQYIFATDWADVALNIQQRLSDEHLDLIGQILGNTATLAADPIVVQLLLHEREVAITLADELGEFMFPAIEPGNYGLILSTDQVEIELPSFALTLD